jgi:hypothetical protein
MPFKVKNLSAGEWHLPQPEFEVRHFWRNNFCKRVRNFYSGLTVGQSVIGRKILLA